MPHVKIEVYNAMKDKAIDDAKQTQRNIEHYRHELKKCESLIKTNKKKLNEQFRVAALFFKEIKELRKELKK